MRCYAPSVKQHVYPHDLHTPERKNAIVDSLIDPGQFGQAFELASARIGDATSPQAATYEDFVRSLNRRRIPDGLRARFAAQGRDLSRNARVRGAVADAAWIIRDRVRHENEKARVTYDVGEARASFSLQLFFRASELDAWRGKLGTLASFLEGEPDSAAAEARFPALVTTLPSVPRRSAPLGPSSRSGRE